MGDNESGGNRKESPEKEAEMVRARDGKTGAQYTVGRRAMEMKVQGRRKRVRPNRRWLDRVRVDTKEKGLSGEEVYDRATWRRMSSYIRLNPT